MNITKDLGKRNSASTSEDRRHRQDRYKIAAILLGVALILFVTRQYAENAADASHPPEHIPVSGVQSPPIPSENFPAKDSNTAKITIPEAHIQMF